MKKKSKFPDDLTNPNDDNEKNNFNEQDEIESAPESGTLPDSDGFPGKSEIIELRKKCDEFSDRYLRTLAEFDNFRKRTAKEKSSMFDEGIKAAALKFLPVIDNFRRAMAQGDPEDSFYKGVEMIFKQMNDALKELEITEIDAEGQPFDLNLHDAVMHIEDENFGQNIVAQEFQKGYVFKDKTIRHSIVKVAN